MRGIVYAIPLSLLLWALCCGAVALGRIFL
jgi:hypothetical protein